MIDPAAIAALQNVLALVIPEIILVVGACLLFMVATIRGGRDLPPLLALFFLAAAWLFALLFASEPVRLTSISPIVNDSFAQTVRYLALTFGTVLVLSSWLAVPEKVAPEYQACLLVATVGLSLCGSANELVTLFLALELISIPTYVMLYLPRTDLRSQEATLKYFLLSIFSSAFLLFGFSYLYGTAGTTNLSALHAAFLEVGRTDEARMPVVAIIGIVMVTAGLCFKLTAAPFHFYAPDVYQGAATAPVALLAVLPKIAGAVALVRVLGLLDLSVYAFHDQLRLLFWLLAALTMTLGNVLALWQDNLRRLLAYSSVAHAGYMLIAFAAAAETGGRTEGAVNGVTAILFYLVAYSAMTLGTFGVLAMLETRERPVETVDDLAGVGSTHPWLGGLLALFLFSLIGMPLTAGFYGKFLVFASALPISLNESTPGMFQWLVLLGAVNAAIAAYYYLRVIGVLYLREAIKPLPPVANVPGFLALGVCGLLTLGLGMFPNPVVKVARGTVTAAAPVVVPVAVAER